jgi:preprotein translocase subunit SecG
MLLGLLLTLNIMVCLALIGVVLLQRSEGGALGTGGNPTGLITTRGAGDLLTRTTWVLFVIFLSLSLSLTLLGGHARSDQATVARFKSLTVNPDALRKTPPAPGTAPAAPAGQAVPRPVQLPPLAGAANPGQATHSTTAPAARPASPRPDRAAAGQAAPATPPTSALSLPPLAGSPPPAQAPASIPSKTAGPSS